MWHSGHFKRPSRAICERPPNEASAIGSNLAPLASGGQDQDTGTIVCMEPPAPGTVPAASVAYTLSASASLALPIGIYWQTRRQDGSLSGRATANGDKKH